MSIEIKSYEALTKDEFHALIALRIEVFVVEQNCPYQDLDGKDLLSFHLLLKDEKDQLIGTARILPAGLSYPEISIGRVLTNAQNRKKGFGHEIMRECLAFVEQKWGDSVAIKISAQSHLKSFYNQHGFESTGKEYLEDGIPHSEMIKNN
ncbi:MAG: GNAT family N-acetyltransferase [Crocinitomicaceae bacterium]